MVGGEKAARCRLRHIGISVDVGRQKIHRYLRYMPLSTLVRSNMSNLPVQHEKKFPSFTTLHQSDLIFG